MKKWNLVRLVVVLAAVWTVNTVAPLVQAKACSNCVSSTDCKWEKKDGWSSCTVSAGSCSQSDVPCYYLNE